MRRSTVVRALLAGIVVAVAAIVLTGGDDPYEVQLRLANAGGLKDGSPVTFGGVRVGKVDVDVDVEGGVAVARLLFDEGRGPVGKDVRATIASQNLLGQKQLQLTPGNAKADPAPDEFVVPADRVTEGTELDRVLSVLDADTRTRLAIFVNEAGTAVTGRKTDLMKITRELAPSIGSANDLVAELAGTNSELGRLLETADGLMAEVNGRRGEVVKAIDQFGRAATVGATKRAELRRTLAEAPGALRTLQTFLAELRDTTVPLGPAARQLSAAAGPLRRTLAGIEPFTEAAAPTLDKATDVAPTLTLLADKAAPIIKQAKPTLRNLRATAVNELPPVLRTTDKSIANTLAVIENWAGAIQFRDKLSHIFRGEASIAPDLLNSMLERLAPTPTTRESKKAPKGRTPPASSGAPAPKVPSAPKLPTAKVPDVVGTLKDTVDGVGKAVDDAVKDLTGRLQGKGDPAPSSGPGLLDSLLKP